MRRLVTCIAILTSALAAPVPSKSVSSIAIAGQIGNGTEGAPVPEELVVTAIQISGDQEVERRQTTAAMGSFRIEGFEAERGNRFLVTTDYLGVSYSTGVEGEGPELRLDLQVFETTDDETVISVSSDVLTVVEGEGDALEAIQLLRFANASDRTFVGAAGGETRGVLRLPVPQGAFDLLPLEGVDPQQLTSAPDGVVTGQPVIPGELKVSYLYRVRVPRGGWDLRRAVLYPTAKIEVLAGQGLIFEGPAFRLEKEVTLAGKNYRQYRGGSFEAGSVLEGLVRPEGSPGAILPAGVAFGFLVLAALGTAIFLRRRTKPPSSSPAERERLIEEIARLDEEFESGSVREKVYLERRADMKEKLRSMSDSMRP